MSTSAPRPIPVFRTPLNVVAGIVTVSVAASLFLVWLVYFHAPSDVSGTRLAFLPALNALLNSFCTVALLFGIFYIKHGQITKHRNSMFAAFFFSTLFLFSYIANHYFHGDALFPKSHPTARVIYLWVLLTPHILASVIALPMILVTFFFSLSGRFTLHRAIARYTFPVWLYVSVSGVIVYAMLAHYR